MIELGKDRLHDLSRARKSTTQSSLVQRAAKFDGHAEVVAVQRFTDAARQHDEVGRAVDQVVACDADRVIRHGGRN